MSSPINIAVGSGRTALGNGPVPAYRYSATARTSPFDPSPASTRRHYGGPALLAFPSARGFCHRGSRELCEESSGHRCSSVC